MNIMQRSALISNYQIPHALFTHYQTLSPHQVWKISSYCGHFFAISLVLRHAVPPLTLRRRKDNNSFLRVSAYYTAHRNGTKRPTKGENSGKPTFLSQAGSAASKCLLGLLLIPYPMTKADLGRRSRSGTFLPHSFLT